MKLMTLKNGTPDGCLHIVSKDLSRVTPAKAAQTMQNALDNWVTIEADLIAEYDALNTSSDGAPYDAAQAMAPLPRAWQWLDGSAFDSHGDLMDIVFGLEKKDLKGRPLMYQGVSDCFFGAQDDIPMVTEDDFIDFEGEFGVIVDEVPLNADVKTAKQHIRLIVQINDWSLRRLAPIEMKTGFGWIQAKPPCSVAPVAVTPDELGAAWRDARVDLPLNVKWNGKQFGAASGYAMSSGFDDLVAHAAYSRRLVPGTVIGSGTVSNENYREIGSSCIAEKRGIELLDLGAPKTNFMSFGDRVEMEAKLADGTPLFGKIDQKVFKA
ncbi:MAG: fumarylacetoacetate hydrolase [Rhodobacteraceae bacterium]|nr:MAG: fumarylacetoacetate hydrolase [Paracoccaceae bacterium]